MARSRKWKNKPAEIKIKSRLDKMERQIAAAGKLSGLNIDAGDFTLNAQAQAMRRLQVSIGGPISRGGLR